MLAEVCPAFFLIWSRARAAGRRPGSVRAQGTRRRRDRKGNAMRTDHIEVLTHSSIRIKTPAGTVYVDPFQVKDAPRDGAFVFVTHDHFDHFSPEDIAKAAAPGAVLIVPETMAEKAQETAGLVGRIMTVAQAGSYEAGGLAFETVPAYNVDKAFHPKEAGWVGYLLHTDQMIYIAGDTDITEENRAVRCDVAMLPIGGTYTMDAAQAAELANAIRPAVAIPTHYGSVAGSEGDAEVFASQVNVPVAVVIKKQY